MKKFFISALAAFSWVAYGSQEGDLPCHKIIDLVTITKRTEEPSRGLHRPAPTITTVTVPVIGSFVAPLFPSQNNYNHSQNNPIISHSPTKDTLTIDVKPNRHPCSTIYTITEEYRQLPSPITTDENDKLDIEYQKLHIALRLLHGIESTHSACIIVTKKPFTEIKEFFDYYIKDVQELAERSPNKHLQYNTIFAPITLKDFFSHESVLQDSIGANNRKKVIIVINTTPSNTKHVVPQAPSRTNQPQSKISRPLYFFYKSLVLSVGLAGILAAVYYKFAGKSFSF